MTVPDAWDECGGCGHDRDDHHVAWCGGVDYSGRDPIGCDCRLFTDAADA